MTLDKDLLAAKSEVSGRWLAAGLKGNVMAAVPAVRVAAAASLSSGNVHAVGVGRKIVDGEPTSELCVRFYVLQKLARSLIPPQARLPGKIAGFATDVIESMPAFAFPKPESRQMKKGTTSSVPTCSTNRKRSQRPVVAGISAAHVDVTAGTIACFCRRADHENADTVFTLSNNHVFADVNAGSPGDDLLQPGKADGGTGSDHFANLEEFVPIRLGGQQPNKVDAAIGRLLADVVYEPEVCSIGRIVGTEAGLENMPVRKHGRTSGYTEGVITDESYDALVGMDHSDPSVVALFENQMRIERTGSFPHLGLGGDSGSLVVHKSRRRAVGLYFAGPTGGVYGIANHIADVLSALRIAII